VPKVSARRLLRVELHGVEPPGRSCGPRPGGGWYEDIQVLAALSSVRKRVVANMIPRSAAYARSSARGPAEPRLPGP
jgi:hypothetical protein